ncbi:hypothetical protein QAD02_024233 [Eretmocerus hayati]|uniref:Uncharacterized protein n=1 Tax=Eretmocerus hayati TaxID=131215 RepID=A0ACC2PZP6_9HYME|nr:hypothetical protein QAD02_024233 [Eretmocerus hayati]
MQVKPPRTVTRHIFCLAHAARCICIDGFHAHSPFYNCWSIKIPTALPSINNQDPGQRSACKIPLEWGRNMNNHLSPPPRDFLSKLHEFVYFPLRTEHKVEPVTGSDTLETCSLLFKISSLPTAIDSDKSLNKSQQSLYGVVRPIICVQVRKKHSREFVATMKLPCSRRCQHHRPAPPRIDP